MEIIFWLCGPAAVIAYLLFSIALAAWTGSGRIFLRRFQENLELRNDLRGAAIVSRDHQVRLSLQFGKQTSLFCTAILLGFFYLTRSGTLSGFLLFSLLAVLVIFVVDFLLLRTICAFSPEPVLRWSFFVIRISYFLFFPLARPAVKLHQQFSREPNGDEQPSEEVLEAYIDVGEEEGILEAEEGHLLRSIVDFGDTVVSEVMTPRTDMVCVEEKATIAEVRDLFIGAKHSRIPVYGETMDQVVGIAYARDLLESWSEGQEKHEIASIIRPPLFVPETKKIAELLAEFRDSKVQLAIVVDEYGGTAGLVTLEDLLEEIVGEIQDEYDEEEPLLIEESGGSYRASAMLDVDEFEQQFDVEVKGEEFETLGGLVIAELGHVPQTGESLVYQGLLIEVLEADQRRIYNLRIQKKDLENS